MPGIIERCKNLLFLRISPGLSDEDRRFAHQLQFDYFKHLSSLTIATIGGAIIMAGSFFAEVEDKQFLWIAVGLLAFSIYFNILGQDEIIKGSFQGKSRIRRVRLAVSSSLLTFALGLGMFLAYALENLGLSL